MYYGDLKWPDVPRVLQVKWLVIPVGSIEQHGPHLPLNVDAILAEELAAAVATDVDGIVAPTISYGARSLPNSGGGPSYPGTIYTPGPILTQMYREILSSFAQNGARQILLLNAHWENEPLLFEAVEQCREAGYLNQRRVIALSWWSVIPDQDMIRIFGNFDGWHVEHAGQAETALMLALRPETVDMNQAVDNNNIIPSGIHCHPTPPAWIGTDGVLSRTRHANAEMGRQLATLITNGISRQLKSL